MEIHMKTIRYSKEKRYKLRKRELTLQKELQDLGDKICVAASALLSERSVKLKEN